MQKIISFYVLFLLASCSLEPLKEENLVYMPKEDVLKEMEKFSEDSVMDEPLTVEDREREKHLVPDNEFISKKEQAKMMNFMSEQVQGSYPEGVLEVDLRSRDSEIKHQDDGKCTAYAGTAALENMINKKGVQSGLDLSEWNAWSLYQEYSIEAFIDALSKFRIGDEKDYPQYGKAGKGLNPHAKLKTVNYIGNDTYKMVEALRRGNVVYIGMKTPKEMLQCKKFVSPFTGAASGGHALLISGYYIDTKVKGDVVAIIKNSWGPDCGDKGYQYVALGNICHRSDFYCSMYEIAEVDDNLVPGDVKPLPDTPVVVKPEVPKKKVCVKKWYSPWKKTCYLE